MFRRTALVFASVLLFAAPAYGGTQQFAQDVSGPHHICGQILDFQGEIHGQYLDGTRLHLNYHDVTAVSEETGVEYRVVGGDTEFPVDEYRQIETIRLVSQGRAANVVVVRLNIYIKDGQVKFDMGGICQ